MKMIRNRYSARDIVELIQKPQIELENFLEWMWKNKMNANPKQTEYMFIGHPSRINKITDITNLKMNGREIKSTYNVKSLGLAIDEKLNRNDHSELLQRKVGAGLSSLKQFKNILPKSKLCSVHRALVKSHIWYVDVVWCNLYTAAFAGLSLVYYRKCKN